MTAHAATFTARPELSLVLPAANEERRLPASLLELREYLAAQSYRAEVIVVDDGSTDATVAVVREAARHFPASIAIGVISHPRNLGKGAAVRSGCLAVRGRYVLYMDADLAVPLAEIGRILAALRGGCPVAIGVRIQADGRDMRASQPFARRLAGAAFTALRRVIVVSAIVDTQCPLKGFEATVARALFRAQRLRGWSFDAEILFLAHRQRLRICQIPVAWRHQEGSRLRPSAGLALRVGWDLARLRWLHRRPR